MLTEAKLKALKPRQTLYRVADAHGLCIEVTPKGSKLWRLRFRYAGKAKMISLGSWPLVSLATARQKRDDARRLLLNGVSPMEQKRGNAEEQERRARGMFEPIAKEWLAHKKKSVGDETYRKSKLVTEGDLIPALKRHSIDALATKDCTKVLREIAERAPNMAIKARQCLSAIVDYAIKEGLREDGKHLSLRGVIPAFRKGHISAITKPTELASLLRAIDKYSAPLTRAALKLTSLTSMRPIIIVSARWEHIDLAAREWHVPGVLMKTGSDHIVSLPRQAIEILQEMRPVAGRSEYVFPSPAKQQTPHLHRDTLSKALRTMGFKGKHATHGFRATLRTVARERLNVDIDVLEAQLAHAKNGDVQKAYDRTTFDDDRRRVMQTWADYLDALRQGKGKSIPLRHPEKEASA